MSDDYVYCMFGVNPCNTNFSFTNEQKENIKNFGDTALLILDNDEFFNRMRNAARREGYKIHSTFVHYYEENQDSVNPSISLLQGMHNIAFWKRRKYSYQQEFRFSVHTKDHEQDHLELNTGDIRDISKIFKASEIVNAQIVKTEGNVWIINR